jgi:hypothetical protein
VLVEQLDRSARQRDHGLVRVPRERQELAEREPVLEEAERAADHVDVRGRVPDLPVDRAAELDPLTFDRLDQRGGDAAAAGEPVQAEEFVLASLSARRRDRYGQVGVRGVEPIAEHPLDRRERQAPTPKLTDLADPPGVAIVVPGDATLAGRRRDEAAGLVVADRIDRHVARGRDLLHAIPHDR